jgi:hypothetical protein
MDYLKFNFLKLLNSRSQLLPSNKPQGNYKCIVKINVNIENAIQCTTLQVSSDEA